MRYTISMDKQKKSRRILLLLLCIVAVVVVFFFAGKMFLKFTHSRPPVPRQTNVELIQEWMTLPYVSRTYGVPFKDLREGLKLSPNENERESIKDLAKSLNIESAVFIDELQVVITRFQDSHSMPAKPL